MCDFLVEVRKMKASINELEQRLKYLENTVGMLNQELPRLRQDFEQLKAENLGQYSQVQSNIQSEITSQGQYTNIVQPQVQSQYTYPNETQRSNPSQGYYTPTNYTTNQIKQVSKNKSMENFIGKNLMPIAASILTFIALIMFATVVLPNLTDTLKMIAMYVFSGGLIIISEVLLKKHKQNNWLLALLGCGVGAIFISLFVTTIYFKAISEITLYGLIVLWVIYTCYLGKHKNMAFSIIGQIGICVAMCFSIPYTTTTAELSFVSIILFLAELAFVISDIIKPNYFTIMATNIGLVFSGVVIFNAYGYDKDIFPTNMLEGVILLCLIVAAIITNVRQGITIKENDTYGVIYIIHTGLLFLGLVELVTLLNYSITNQFSVFDVRKYPTVFSIPLLCVGFGLIAYFGKNITVVRYVVQGILSCFIGDSLITSYKVVSHIDEPFYNNYSTPIYSYMYFILLIVIFFGLATYKHRIEYSIYGSLIFAIFAVFVETDFLLPYSLVVAGVFGILAYLFLTRNIKSVLANNVCYGALLFSCIGLYVHLESPLRRFFMNIEGYNYWDVDNVIMLGVLLILQVCAFKTTLFDIKLIDESFCLIPRLCNVPIMLFSLICLWNIDNSHYGLVLIATCFVVGLFTLTVKFIINHFVWGGAYVGFKYTLLCYVILNVVDSAKFVFSVVGLVVALVCITLGFYLKIKSLRLYGLVLSILCVFKLIMFDIVYSDTVGRATSFLVSGILCFVISLIYNKLDTKLRNSGGYYEKENSNNTMFK